MGARVRQFRLRKGLSQTKLADALGVTFQQVQKYENGTNAIATARLPMLCDELEITPNDLYGDLFTNKGGKKSAAPQLDTVTVKAAIMMDRMPPRVNLQRLQIDCQFSGEGPLDRELLQDGRADRATLSTVRPRRQGVEYRNCDGRMQVSKKDRAKAPVEGSSEGWSGIGQQRRGQPTSSQAVGIRFPLNQSGLATRRCRIDATATRQFRYAARPAAEACPVP